VIQQVVTKSTAEKLPAATHWSARAMAKAVGIAVSSVQRIWQAHGLKPHLVRSFKLSNDPAFTEKLVIRNWVVVADRQEGRRKANPAPAEATLNVAEREELARLRRENKQLPQERDILSRAAAWFARETGTIPSRSSS
jgi:transposase